MVASEAILDNLVQKVALEDLTDDDLPGIQAVKNRLRRLDEQQQEKTGPRLNTGWQGLLEFVYVAACTTVSFLFFTLLYVFSFTWLLQFSGNKALKSLHRFLAVMPFAHLILFKTIWAKHFNAAKVVFVCYPPERLWDHANKIRLIRWFFKEPCFVIGNLHWRGATVGNIALIPPLSTINSPDVLQSHLQWVLDVFKDSTFALSGQLPSICSQMGLKTITSDRRVVDGRVGTVALGRRGAERGVEWLRSNFPKLKSKRKLNLCVLGGGGYTGTEIGRACRDLFANVYLVDSKFGYKPSVVDRSMGPSVVGTSNPYYVENSDVVLVFLPSGDLVKPYLKFAHRKQVWIDDTHPPIPPSIREDLMAVTNLFRLTARSSSMGMFPPLPNWRPQDLPGCLLTAVAVAMNQEEFKTGAPLMCEQKGGLTGIKKFIRTAEGMGIELGIFPVEEAETFKVLNMSLLPKEE